MRQWEGIINVRGFAFLACMFGATTMSLGQRTKSFDSVSYFPKEVFRDIGNKVDSMKFIWYSRLLADFEEPKLFNIEDPPTIYRLTWTRSFDGAMTIRLVTTEHYAYLITKTEQHVEQGKPSNSKKKESADSKFSFGTDSLDLGMSTMNTFNELLTRNDIWKMTNLWSNSMIHDGAGWLLEVWDPAKGYTMLYRHSPDESKEAKFRTVCLFLIRLTKDADKLKIY